MSIYYLPTHGKTVYSFGGGSDDVQVTSLSDATSYRVDLGGGNDSALLGAGDDVVVGGKGSDSIYAGGGNDEIYGGEMNANISVKGGKVETDFLVGDYKSNNAPVIAAMGADTIHGATGSASLVSTIYGDTDGMVGTLPAHLGEAPPITVVAGNDVIFGGSGTNNIWGDSWRIATDSTGGNDVIYGGTGAANLLVGDCDWSIGICGNDLIFGGAGGTNEIYGDARKVGNYATGGDDLLVAGDGAVNYMYGDALIAEQPIVAFGRDELRAGTGTDHMWGDYGTASGTLPIGGADVFRFDGGIFGQDDINDFRHADGDTIQFGGDPSTFVVTTSNGNTVFTDNATGGVLTVVGVVGLVADVDYAWVVA
jgi:Ca2+-binding RTX toxin-like protein